MKKTKITLSTDIKFLQVVTSFVENSSLAFGLGRQETLRLTLASEEIFSYLCGVLGEEKELEVTCTEGIYFVSVEFIFERVALSLKAFNITARPFFRQDQDIDEMGLLLAARSVDRLSLNELPDKRLNLKIIKDKAYPEPEEVRLPVIAPVESYFIKRPDLDEIKMLSRLISTYYRDYPVPVAYTIPGKLSDMVASRLYDAAIATDKTGLIVAGLIWKRMNEKVVELFGPYLFNQKKESNISESLVNFCIEDIARTEIIGVFVRFATPEFPKGSFEPTGSLYWYNREAIALEMPTYYRALHEDAGAVVYIPASLSAFIEDRYRSLALPREVIISSYYGEDMGDNSVIITELDQTQRAAIMHPLQPGKDSLENIQRHIQIFKKEGINNIFSLVDLGIRGHLFIMDDLFNCGFEPRTIIPHGQRSDLVFFQYKI
ncbi:MAG: hypothetical protein N3D15_07025 [Syntrophorhabdaceae bacterium]|nr:hypothetical protein [Syntrophorhabdaceae bacterium]